jgi:hypothetical protein
MRYIWDVALKEEDDQIARTAILAAAASVIAQSGNQIENLPAIQKDLIKLAQKWGAVQNQFAD